MFISEKRLRPWSWIVLGTVLALLLLGAWLAERSGWPRPGLLPGEATYLGQAESLAHDFDLVFTSAEFRRSFINRGGEPPDLALASGSAGRGITYDRPFAYALWLAPFVRLDPENGFAVANVLVLAGTAIFAALVLESSLGTAAALWIAVFLAGSVVWRYTFLISGDLFLMALVVLAWGLIVREHLGAARLTGRRRGPNPPALPWFAAGVLLAVPFMTEPLYGVLAAAAFFAVPAGEGLAFRRGAFLAGLGACVLVLAGAQWWASGGLHVFGSERFRFTPESGFPLIDFAAGEWPSSLRRLGALYWDEAPRFSWGVDAFLYLWNLLYLVLGRHLGLVPYFLPFVLVLTVSSFHGFRRPLWIAVGAFFGGLMILHPFDLAGGAGAIGNRHFLPIYGAAWFLADRDSPRLGDRFFASPVTLPALVLLVSALFLAPLWTSPWSLPTTAADGHRYVSPVAERALPYETSQRWLPVQETADLAGLKIAILNEDVWAESRRERLMLGSERRARLVVASPEPLDGLALSFGADAPSEIELRGVRLNERVLASGGGIVFRLRPGLVRRHPMWWSPEAQWHYCLSFELAEDERDDQLLPLAFQLNGEVEAVAP